MSKKLKNVEKVEKCQKKLENVKQSEKMTKKSGKMRWYRLNKKE